MKDRDHRITGASDQQTAGSNKLGWREKLYEIIFEADTPAGKAFDVALLILIGLSVGAVMLESVEEIKAVHGRWLRIAEWGFTSLFTLYGGRTPHGRHVLLQLRPQIQTKGFGDLAQPAWSMCHPTPLLRHPAPLLRHPERSLW